MQPIRITGGPAKIMRKGNQFSQFRLTFTKVITIEKTYTDYISIMIRDYISIMIQEIKEQNAQFGTISSFLMK